MDGFGPITDTHSLEDSVVEALEQLEGLQESAKLNALRERGVRYRDILASWEMMPPRPQEQAETVSHVLQLLGEIMAFVSGANPCSRPPSSSSPPAGVTPSPPTSKPPSPSPFAGKRPWRGGRQDRVPRRGARTNKRQASVGRIELEQIVGGDVTRADILYPFRRDWSKLDAVPGGVRRLLHDDPVTGEQHIIVRLVDGAMLPEHGQDNAELVYILSGGLRVGDESVFAGAVLRSYAGSVCPALTSLGETELLFIGSYRDELRAASDVATRR